MWDREENEKDLMVATRNMTNRQNSVDTQITEASQMALLVELQRKL